MGLSTLVLSTGDGVVETSEIGNIRCISVVTVGEEEKL